MVPIAAVSEHYVDADFERTPSTTLKSEGRLLAYVVVVAKALMLGTCVSDIRCATNGTYHEDVHFLHELRMRSCHKEGVCV
jgi:hypothetical protein